MNNLKKQWGENSTTVLLGLGLIVAILLFGFVYMNNKEEGKLTPIGNTDGGEQYETSNNNPAAILKTSMGDIVLEIYKDKTPTTAGNFLTLAQDGFYNGTKFHRVIKDFMIQGGDPNTKEDDESLYGRGGPGYTIEDEFDRDLSNLRGTVAMANIGQPDTGGSQFFINYANNVFLDFNQEPSTSKHAVFGHVISGMDVVDTINRVQVKEPGVKDIPVDPISILEIIVQNPQIVEEESELDDDADEETEKAL